MASFSYWNEYQRALKKIKELEEEIERLNKEIECCKTDVNINLGQTTKPTDDYIGKLMEYRQKYQEEVDKNNKLEEELHKLQQADQELKVAVHTNVIQAINSAFDDY